MLITGGVSDYIGGLAFVSESVDPGEKCRLNRGHEIGVNFRLESQAPARLPDPLWLERRVDA